MIGILKKKNRTINIGIITIALPVSIIVFYFLYDFLYKNFTEKPNKNDLVGVYHISEAGKIIPKSLYNSYKLEFKDDGKFHLSSTPDIEICENGKYSVDWEFEQNEVSFECNQGFLSAHIDRGFSGFRIEFFTSVSGDRNSIYFKKDK